MKIKTYPGIVLFIIICICLNSCKPGEDVNSSVVTTGVSDDEIVIGSWGPLTGPAALWGSIVKGMDAYFKLVNEDGGIHGRIINFKFKDDAYDPSRTVPAVRELVQRDEVFALAGGVGTATNMAVADFISENKIPWITPITGASIWSNPTKPHIFTTFPLYFDEGDIQAKYALNQMKTTKVAVIYQNDDFGKSGLTGAKHYLQQNNLDFVAELPVEVSDTDLSSHAARLKESGAEIVLLWVLPRQAAIILGSCAVIDFNPVWFSTLALSDMTLMHQITKGAWEGVLFNYVADVMFNDESNVEMLKYRDAFAKYYPDERWGTFALAGFLWAEPLIEGLRKTGRDLSRESFLSAMESIEDYVGVGGIPVSFSSDNHLGTRSIRIMKCVNGEVAEAVGELISGNTNIELLEAILKGS